MDLTRVIAGPVCTRLLGALGADVLRLDPPNHLDLLPGSVSDTLLGKSSGLLDFDTTDGLARLHHLLDRADVLVHGYRPGSLDRFGLGARDVAARHPGLVVVHLDAWGHRGPWSRRRGFDSIVQAACGIATIESADGVAPGALPCQLLDHGTGYLAAAAVLDGLRRQGTEGGTQVRSLSLARTGAWLTRLPAASGQPGLASPAPGPMSPADPWLVEMDSSLGPVTAVAPPGQLNGQALAWPPVARPYGQAEPAWRT